MAVAHKLVGSHSSWPAADQAMRATGAHDPGQASWDLTDRWAVHF